MMNEREGRRLALLFLLGDVCYSMLFDVEEALKPQSISLKQESKLRFKQMLSDLKVAERSCHRATKGVGEHSMEYYIDDSDYLRDVLELIYDKTLGNEQNQVSIKEMLNGLVNDKK